MPQVQHPRALLCLNLRKEWVSDQRAVAAALERQAWCLEKARRSGWSVFHAYVARRLGAQALGALLGLAPLREEPVFVITAPDRLGEALRARGAAHVSVIGVGRSSTLVDAAASVGTLCVVSDAFVDLDAAPDKRVARRDSLEAFNASGADIIVLKSWRGAKAPASEGA